MCDLRFNSLCKKLCPILLPFPGGGAWSQWSSQTGAAHLEGEPGQMTQQPQGAAGVDPSVLGLPGPP